MTQHGYSDAELDDMFGTNPTVERERDDSDDYEDGDQAAPSPPMMMAPLPPLQMIPLGQATPSTSFLTKPVLGMPLWLVGLGTVALGGGAWWWYSAQKKGVTPNDPEPTPEPTSSDRGGGWSPGRGAVGDQLEKHFSRKGIKAVVWRDAEEAKKKGVKHRSPLVTITSNTKLDNDREIQKICKREGLSATPHDDGSIGLYPGSGKRAKEWESYIDLLRDDGQTD